MSFARGQKLWCSSGMRPGFVFAIALAIAGCAGELPSAQPLGEGPLAVAEAKANAKAEKEAEAKAKGQTAAGPKPPEAPPPIAKAEPPKPPPAAEKPKTEAAKSETKPGKDSKKAGAGVVYAGEYVGSDSSVYKVAGAERSETDDKARTRVSANGTDLSVTFVDSSNGKDICTLKATATGKSASFTPGQKCWTEPGMSGALRSGKATFEDKRLVIDMDFDLELSGEGDNPMTGTLLYHFDGTRK